MCGDVCDYICEFANPYLFEVGCEIEVHFTCKDGMGDIVNEYNYYEIMEIDRTSYPYTMLVEEMASGGVSLFYQSKFYDNDEEEAEAFGKPHLLIIDTDKNGDEFTTSFSHYNDGDDYEWDAGEGYNILKDKFEAKDM